MKVIKGLTLDLTRDQVETLMFYVGKTIMELKIMELNATDGKQCIPVNAIRNLESINRQLVKATDEGNVTEEIFNCHGSI